MLEEVVGLVGAFAVTGLGEVVGAADELRVGGIGVVFVELGVDEVGALCGLGAVRLCTYWG